MSDRNKENSKVEIITQNPKDVLFGQFMFISRLQSACHSEISNSLFYRYLSEKISGNDRVLYRSLIEEMADESYQHYLESYKILQTALISIERPTSFVCPHDLHKIVKEVDRSIKNNTFNYIDTLLESEIKSLSYYQDALDHIIEPFFYIQDYLEAMILEENKHIYELRKLKC